MDRTKKTPIARDRHRLNNRIRARQVRVIGENGEQLGIFTTDEALRMAEEQNLDLVEVAPNATPPVCRLMDYGKFRYEQSKKEREARKHQKQIELKEVRLRPRTDSHDMEVKARQARRFLLAGDKVKFTLRFRGREMAHTNIGREMLEQLAEALRDIAIVEQRPTLESRAFSLVLAPTSKVAKAAKQSRQQLLQKAAVSSKQPPSSEQKPADHPEDDELDEEDLLEDDEAFDEDGEDEFDEDDEDEFDEDDEDEFDEDDEDEFDEDDEGDAVNEDKKSVVEHKRKR